MEDIFSVVLKVIEESKTNEFWHALWTFGEAQTHGNVVSWLALNLETLRKYTFRKYLDIFILVFFHHVLGQGDCVFVRFSSGRFFKCFFLRLWWNFDLSCHPFQLYMSICIYTLNFLIKFNVSLYYSPCFMCPMLLNDWSTVVLQHLKSFHILSCGYTLLILSFPLILSSLSL